MNLRSRSTVLAGLLAVVLLATPAVPQRTVKPVLHGQRWVAITGKPLAATAGAMIFTRGGNAVDAACAMLAATSTMWDTLGWGGETQALIFNPKTGEVKGINALGVAPPRPPPPSSSVLAACATRRSSARSPRSPPVHPEA